MIVSSLTWTHTLTARFSAVLKVADFLGSDGWTREIVGADYRQATRRLDDGRRLSGSLIWRFSKVH